MWSIGGRCTPYSATTSPTELVELARERLRNSGEILRLLIRSDWKEIELNPFERYRQKPLRHSAIRHRWTLIAPHARTNCDADTVARQPLNNGNRSSTLIPGEPLILAETLANTPLVSLTWSPLAMISSNSPLCSANLMASITATGQRAFGWK